MTRDRQKGHAAWTESHNGSESESREKAGPPSCEPVPEREASATKRRPAGREASSHGCSSELLKSQRTKGFWVISSPNSTPQTPVVLRIVKYEEHPGNWQVILGSAQSGKGGKQIIQLLLGPWNKEAPQILSHLTGRVHGKLSKETLHIWRASGSHSLEHPNF